METEVSLKYNTHEILHAKQIKMSSKRSTMYSFPLDLLPNSHEVALISIRLRVSAAICGLQAVRAVQLGLTIKV